MALEEESQNLTALITPLGLYKWKSLLMGLASATGAFQNLMELIFAGFFHKIALYYLDYVIVFGRNFDKHLKRFVKMTSEMQESEILTNI